LVEPANTFCPVQHLSYGTSLTLTSIFTQIFDQNKKLTTIETPSYYHALIIIINIIIIAIIIIIKSASLNEAALIFKTAPMYAK
jgi:hypothetical protein